MGVVRTYVWAARVVVATALLTGIGLYGDAAQAAETVGATADDASSATWAIAVFIAVWLVASLRIRRRKGSWALGFEPAPTRRTSANRNTRRASIAGGGASGAGASGGF
jgi:hypothetical protein